MRYPKIILFLVVLSFTSCAISKITSVVDPSSQGKTCKSILVISTFSDLIQKEKVELAFTNSFSKKNIYSLRGSVILPPTREYSTEEISQILLNNTIDGVLVVALEDFWEKQTYVPPSSTTTGSAYIINNTIQYSQQTRTSGGFSYKKPRVTFESRLIDMRTGQVIWMATTLTKGNAYAGMGTLAGSLARSTVNKLIIDRVVSRSSANK